jgi:2-polyprenyl-3-methyl-5-hydroxy-6-metoxy-1,4-benzoquinol methylase
LDSPLRSVADYEYRDAHSNESHGYLLPGVRRILSSVDWGGGRRRIFEIGCGNGAVAHALHSEGYEVTGIDASPSGIAQANRAFPGLRLDVASAYDDLRQRYGTFPVVLSLEVIEHLYAPRDFAERAFDLLEPGGLFILSTPYHGYLKNLALALWGAMDRHFTVLWDGGHIKFFSKATLSRLLSEAGFSEIWYIRVGRIPPLAKSMIVAAAKP